ncbi:hypothetical protein PACTADRAFT_49469 [Pachysolen tannophilus NRRL Y-2460]|uniref:Reticulon-like protein n=1 Tax=Pachysolen tannophilus NRRL Y-2460 TaxID=669874 RepID=A0A1E4TWD7_PACTA|nr:hypothetical protein PACTADRAFT_49469 [Pachysolen tannophilus NRRL Y-2460]
MSSPSVCCGGSCVSKKSNSLLTWKNPVETGAIFGSIVVSLLVLKYVNVINLLFRALFVILLGSSIAEYSGKLITGTGFVTRFRPAYSNYFQKNADLVSAHFAQYLNLLETTIQELIYAKNIEITLKAGALSYILFKLTLWFSIFTLLLTSTIVAFTAPFIYENNKKQIDELLVKYTKISKQKFFELQEVVKEKAEPLLEKAGPVGNFIKSKLASSRTATSTVNAPAPKTDGTPAFGSSTGVSASTADSTNTTNARFPSVPDSEVPTSTLNHKVENNSNEPIDINAAELADSIIKNKAHAL